MENTSKQSVSCLEQITGMDEAKMFGESPPLGTALRNTLELEKHNLEIGRASLHRATALRLLAESQRSYNVRRKFINDAVRAATHARTNIELIDSPLMWGAAYRVTSEVLDTLYSIESVKASEELAQEIALRRDRAFQLSILYR